MLNTSKVVHPLRKIITKSEVLDILKNSIIYNKDGLLVLNKPYDIGKSRPEKETTTSLSTAPKISCPAYFDELLPDLLKLVPQYKSLTFHKFPDRYFSGVTILAGTDEVRTKLEKCRNRANTPDNFSDTLLVISTGKPIFKDSQTKLAVALKEKQGHGSRLVLLPGWSKRDVKLQRVKAIRMRHQTMHESDLASLSIASFSSYKSNVVRLYFATKLLSPLLGDQLFSNRVSNVMGNPVLIDPWSNPASAATKRLSTEILQALKLNPNESALVPLFVHLAEVRLFGFNRGRDLILQAPLPDNFKWACEKLGLHVEVGKKMSLERDDAIKGTRLKFLNELNTERLTV